jgi:type IV pilus assembly protein PilW
MTTPGRQAGLSLVELMISLTLGLMILSGVLVLFANTSAARNEVERTSRQIENGRYASDLLTEDIRLAGFHGEHKVPTTLLGLALPADPCSVTPGDWSNWMTVHLQGYDDSGFTSANCALTNRKANTDVLVVRRVRACAAGIADCEGVATGKPYLQVSQCATQVATTFQLARLQDTTNPNPPFDMQKRTCLTTALANLREYLVRIYFIATDNGAGQSIPTLKRLELNCPANLSSACTWANVPMVEGIEEFQLRYGLDNNCDGQADVYVANPSTYVAPAGPCTGSTVCPTCAVTQNWMNVVTVQFHLLARNLEPSLGFTDTKKYILGKDAADADIERTPGGAYRRHVYSGLVRVANPAGRRE